MTTTTNYKLLAIMRELINSEEGTAVTLARGLVLKLVTAEPLAIRAARRDAFPSAAEVRILLETLAATLGPRPTTITTEHADQLTAVGHPAHRWGIVRIDIEPSQSGTAETPPTTYETQPEQLFTLPPIAKPYPD